ncbi:hypothetical protein FNV43_RR20335 [Rhamnella rubrinervis]|uniref:Uncharacterized protein n=1 Tax=Rhamnella rubrinervis TaxID=2594499 RepID=A0A8K0E0H2_9ROSA|nr:hypothetical protein FNV43_RR20335 [Rhamnella rubrinervis]
MADILVPIILKHLIKLGEYEVNLLLGVRDQVDLLESDLQFIKAFLQKCARRRNDPIVIELVNQISDVALEIEDIVDAYAARVIRERRRNLLGKLFHCFGHAKVLHGVANKTTRIMNRVENICNNKEKYGIGEADQPSVDDEEAEQSSIERRRNVDEADVVGFEKDTTTLIYQLTNPENLQLDVITIHGMGGLGKSTLARKIYKDTDVLNHFECLAWVAVSQQWQAKTLLLDVLKSFKQISDETSKKVFEELKDELHEHLKGKKYLIVLDDIWSTQVWEELRVAFPDESKGSRILITTRVKDVARHASPTPPHDLKILDENESWILLRKVVFRGRECPPNLEELGKKIAKSCGGLPLSIVLLGGTLAAEKKSHQSWLRFVANVNLYLKQGITCLTLSYNHLPPELKACFLYLGLFPEVSEINVRDFIELWIAEGFIQSDRSTSIYDVAEDYLEKLIDRSMIQVATKRLDGGVKTCRIHDLLRDLCIAESRRDKFFDIYSIDNNVSLNRKSRRLSIQSGESLDFDLPPRARSLFFFDDFVYPISKSSWKQIYKSTKFIRVLYLSRLEIRKIPSQIEELIFLRCLFIKDCKVDNFSSSIWNFWYLETLHLNFYGMGSLPKGIWSVMKNLRYLYVVVPRRDLDLRNIPRRSLMGKPFWNLQVLSWLHVNKNTAHVIAKFPNLRKLGLSFREEIMEEGEVEKVMASIRRLESLRSFKIRKWSAGRMEVGTRLNSLPSTLTKISLTYCTHCTPFDWEIFKVLARQPYLRVLKLATNDKPWVGHPPHELRVVAGEFPRLQVLKLRNLRIKTWKMEKDAMPNLESLFIHDDIKIMLENLPEDELLCRSTLQLVEVIGGFEVQDKLKTMLTDFKIKHPATPCKINITERYLPPVF